MIKSIKEQKNFSNFATIVNALNLDLVDFSVSKNKYSLLVSLTLYKKGGITLDELVSFHEILTFKLEQLLGDKIELSLSSPGIERTIKYREELEIFKSRKVKVLLSNDWIFASIKDVNSEGVFFSFESGEKFISYKDIVKCRLVD